MKNKTLILDPAKTIIDLTDKIEKKEKFAFVNISRSAINAILPEAEKKPPKYFVKAITNCIEIEDPNFLKAVPYEFSSDIENGKYSNLGLLRDGKYYDANMFDHYFSSRKEVVDIFINHYIRDSKNLILSFHDKKTVQKVFGANQLWTPNNSSRIFRFQENAGFLNRALACGSEPTYVPQLIKRRNYWLHSGLIMKHLGYTYDEDKKNKYERYSTIDRGEFHNINHINSIIDEDPVLIEWGNFGI